MFWWLFVYFCAFVNATRIIHLEVRSVSKLQCDYFRLVNRAAEAWTFPGLSVQFAIVESESNSTIDTKQDNVNEFVFGPFADPGHTRRYHTGELDVAIDADRFPNCRTLYATILHETGHVLGLNHPIFRQDSVMGFHLQLQTGSSIFENIPYWVKPTRDDIKTLFFWERTQQLNVRSVDYKALEKLALSTAPSVLSDLQICL